MTPILKSYEKYKLDNYRSISNLLILSEIYVKIVFNQLNGYLDHIELLKPSQFGFRKKYINVGCIFKHSSLCIYIYIYDNLDKRYSAVAIFQDFSKAFNCVSHEILLHKLKVDRVRGLSVYWFRSDLTNRQQYVTYSKKNSEGRAVDCGVVQGSIPT